MQNATVSIKIEPEMKARIKNLAAMSNKNPHKVMREAIFEHVEREEKRERFKIEANEASRDFEETGLHLTQAEVFAWMDRWGTENETKAPECHK